MSLTDPFRWSSDEDLGSSLSEEEDRPAAPKKKTKRAPNPHTDQGTTLSVSKGPRAQMNTAKRAYKHRTDQCKSWKVEGAVNADCLAAEETDGMTAEAKTNILKEWIRMRWGNTRPDTLVTSMTLLVNSADYSGPPRACRIPFTGYVQTKQTSVNPLKAWLPDCKWTQMNGGLCGNPEFGDDMNKTFPWAILPIFSKVALNNAGRKEQRLQKKVSFFSSRSLSISISLRSISSLNRQDLLACSFVLYPKNLIKLHADNFDPRKS